MRSPTRNIAIVTMTIISISLVIPAAHAYIDLAPTLAKLTSDSRSIAVVELVEFDRQTHEVVLKEVRSLKGEALSGLIRHDVTPADGTTAPRPILQWASPGARAVLFSSRGTALVCIGQGWYQVRSSGADQSVMKLSKERPDLPLAYYGSISRLADSVQRMLAGKDAILTVVSHGGEDEAASFDLALNRQSLPELVRVQRIRANLNMPGQVMAASGSEAYFVGMGAVDEAELPELIEKLNSADATARADAADDLRRLGRAARSATESLARLSQIDTSSQVRFSAAAALLRINPKQTGPVDVLAQGLSSDDALVRRQAAAYAGLAGPAAAALTDKLAGLLKDPDESTRVTALQSISLLGPAASGAVSAVAPLLDDPALAIDAADALGRIGVAARPAVKRLAQMLSSDQPAVQWAAVRAMAQIDGEDSRPAVEFIINRYQSGNATEVEGYNMMIYLALLGPVASDAVPTIQSVRIKNPVLPSATQWAIAADKYLPWQAGGRGGRGPGGGPGGMGGPGGGGLGGGIGLVIYQAYVRELGYRLRPAAMMLAGKIMDGTAGEVPDWGYDILTCGPQDAMNILVPHLASDDIVMRERAAVALGYMGPAAAPAKEQISAALNKASSEREKRLIRWSLRQVERE